METQSITLEESRRIAEDIRRQPAWRNDSDVSCDYYDGNQISSQIAQELEARGMGPLITNIIKPTVNALLGMEAQNRSDWRISSDDDEHQEVAEALSAKLHEAERETRADQAISEAYANQVKSGLGWVEVGRNPNPFGYRLRVEPVHRREIFWDWSARKADLSDARYMVRERWYSYDLVAQYFPAKADLINCERILEDEFLTAIVAFHSQQAVENALKQFFLKITLIFLVFTVWSDCTRSWKPF